AALGATTRGRGRRFRLPAASATPMVSCSDDSDASAIAASTAPARSRPRLLGGAAGRGPRLDDAARFAACRARRGSVGAEVCTGHVNAPLAGVAPRRIVAGAQVVLLRDVAGHAADLSGVVVALHVQRADAVAPDAIRIGDLHAERPELSG